MSESSISTQPIEITTKNGHKVIFRPFVTARMDIESKSVILRYSKIDMKELTKSGQTGTAKQQEEAAAKAQKFDDVPVEAFTEIKQIAIKHLVKSINGLTGEEAYDFIMDGLQLVDYNEIVAQCDEINKNTTPSEEEKKA